MLMKMREKQRQSLVVIGCTRVVSNGSKYSRCSNNTDNSYQVTHQCRVQAIHCLPVATAESTERHAISNNSDCEYVTSVSMCTQQIQHVNLNSISKNVYELEAGTEM